MCTSIVVLLAALSLVCLAQNPPTPFTVAPISGLTIPHNNGDPVFVDGCRGIGQAIALQEAAQGSRVVCTTRNLFTYKERAQLAGTTIQLWEMDYTLPGNPLLIGIQFEQVFGRRPVRAYFSALVDMNGLWQSYNRTMGHYSFDMSIAGPYELQNYWTRHDSTSAKMVITSISTFEAWTPLVGLMASYSTLAFERLMNTRAMGVQQLYANTEYLVTFCIFTNTSLVARSVNPTAQVRSGNLFGPQNDYVAQQFQTLANELTLLYGTPASLVALGAVQVATNRSAFNYDTIFDVSGNYSAIFGSVQQYALFSLPGNVFNEVYYEAIKEGFGIDCRLHNAPPGGAKRKRAVQDLRLFRVADDIMARPKYGAHRARYEAAKAVFSQ